MTLVSPQWLSQHLSAPSLRLCDVRWVLGAPGAGRVAYEAGHLPHAQFVDLDAELSAPDDGRAGRHPLPSEGAIAALLARLGVTHETHVVAYDDAGGAIAARLWWLLRATGHGRVSLLDGGLGAWRAAGLPLTSEVEAVAPAPLRPVTIDPARHLSLEALRQALAAGEVTLLDARAAERYRGLMEPVDPRPGHIPGSINVPVGSLLRGGAFLPPDALRARFEAAGVSSGREVVASCGSGVTACHLLFALDLCGLVPFGEARLYPGSYSEWARRPDTEVRLGEAP
jgi:thiosulfate/3-mercaptopyruvate sulfurtransferase